MLQHQRLNLRYAGPREFSTNGDDGPSQPVRPEPFTRDTARFCNNQFLENPMHKTNATAPTSKRPRLLAAVLTAAALVLPYARAQTTGPSSGASGAMSQGSMGSMPHGNMDMKAMMKEHQEKMSAMQMSGNQDTDFATMMRMHHMGGVQMAEHEIKNGKDPEMKKVARKIVANQKKEIAELDKFLAKRSQGKGKP
jgi:uncharacterized protein (DUF305 family)